MPQNYSVVNTQELIVRQIPKRQSKVLTGYHYGNLIQKRKIGENYVKVSRIGLDR